MTREDIKTLEAALNVRMPDAYRAFVLDSRLSEESMVSEELWLHNVSGLIENNLRLREKVATTHHWKLPGQFLCIGTDLSEVWYVMTCQQEFPSVFEVSFQTLEVYREHPSFEEFIESMRQAERDAAEDDARNASASPWLKRGFLAAFVLGWIIYIAYKTTHPNK